MSVFVSFWVKVIAFLGRERLILRQTLDLCRIPKEFIDLTAI